MVFGGFVIFNIELAVVARGGGGDRWLLVGGDRLEGWEVVGGGGGCVFVLGEDPDLGGVGKEGLGTVGSCGVGTVMPPDVAKALWISDKVSRKEVDDLKAERLARTQDPLALMATSNNPYNFPVPHQDQPSFNQNYMQQPMPNPKDITDPTTAMNMALALMAKAFKLNYKTPTNNNQMISSNPRNRQIAQPGINMGQDRQMQMVGGNSGNQFRQYAGKHVRNLNGYNDVQNVGNQNPNGNGNLVAAGAEGNANGHNGNQIRCYNYRGKKEAGIQLQAEEFDLMAAAADLDEIEEVNANCILMANLQQASTSGTQTDKAPKPKVS
uniref:Uncharacterized protein n=1 Tax=Tanacetum cinerariifolium TaxID=118510 RepID=A0A6L2LY39_TANCI|nr:hypothetical protein [Tanacetum cinerariifolium]